MGCTVPCMLNVKIVLHYLLVRLWCSLWSDSLPQHALNWWCTIWVQIEGKQNDWTAGGFYAAANIVSDSNI